MKKTIFFTLILLFLLCMSMSASASKLSFAIDVIANENSMVKTSTINNGEFIFDTSDFDIPLGTNINQIIICSLPDSKHGRLMLDNLYVVENQVIKRDDFSMLRFVPTSENVNECNFTFKPNHNDYEIECTLKALKNVNFSPVVSNSEEISAWTHIDISCYGTLRGFDPDGDEIKYEIVSYPQKGLVEITDVNNGDYVYTPYSKAKGVDSFTYRVVDCYGNYSEECKVNLKIEKLRTSLVFDDIDDCKYKNAILVVANMEVLQSYKDESKHNFSPNELITRQDFLVSLMKVMGAKNVPSVQKTRFADDLEIDISCKGYIESAYSLGIISGIFENDGLHFYPKKPITLAEASVIINNIIGAKNNGVFTTFKDFDEIPTWATDDITALCNIDILQKENGRINANSYLTKEEVSQILVSLLRYQGKL